MRILNRSKFVEIYLDDSKSLITQKFLSKTEEMETSAFKNEMTLFADMCVANRPARALIDLLEMRYPIAPETQVWMNTEVFTRYYHIIKKIAFLMPTELIPNLSVEQVLEEDLGKKFIQSYFDNEKSAMDWLCLE